MRWTVAALIVWLSCAAYLAAHRAIYSRSRDFTGVYLTIPHVMRVGAWRSGPPTLYAVVWWVGANEGNPGGVYYSASDGLNVQAPRPDAVDMARPLRGAAWVWYVAWIVTAILVVTTACVWVSIILYRRGK